MKRYILFIYSLFFIALSAFADDVRITASAPSTVEVGDKFQVKFQINSQDFSNFNAPNFKGFEVLYGPSTSTSSSYQYINGKASHSTSVTYTFTVLCDKAGTYSIGSATVDAGGKTVKSNPITVKVLPLGQGPSSQPSNRGGASTRQTTRPVTTGGNISSKDLFMTATANKTNVYEQEAILLTYKIYSAVNLTQLDGKLPNLDGFQIQEMPLPRTKQFKIESYNGRNYQTVVWSQYLLFPQKSGELVIPSITYEGIVQEINPNIDPIEAFFNGTGGVMDFKKKITTPKVVINVQPLSDKPADFSGGVGNFSIESSINANTVKTNDAINLKVVISGKGNMKLINTPNVAFPKDFETYDAKVTDNFSISTDGLTGTRQFEYLAVPRTHGTYTIPPINFVYFDTSSKSYKTVSTEPYTIVVEKGKGTSNKAVADFTSGQRAVDQIGVDIRYIKRGDSELRKNNETFFSGNSYWLCYVVAVVLFVLIVILANKYRTDNQNVAKSRGRKANKIATKRLKYAAVLLKNKKRGEFYDEVLKALWGYIADKLNMPQEHLNKDNIQSRLEEKGVEQTLIDDFIKALDNCEFARYAPGKGETAMDSVYEGAIDVISKMESKIKR